MTPPPVHHYIEFDILSEPWVKYTLSDNSFVLLRTIATNIVKTGQYDMMGKPLYVLFSNTLQVAHAPKDLRGNPTIPLPTPEQIGDSIVAEVNFTPDTEEWNSYKCEDGTTIQLRTQVITIKRTAKYDQFGEPVYVVHSQNLIKDEVPKILWKKSSSQNSSVLSP